MQRLVILILFTALGTFGALMAPGAQQQPPTAADAQERAKLLELQRTAVAEVQRAGREGTAPDEVRRALTEASRSLASLGAEPASHTPKAALDAPLRGELRRAAADLTALAAGDLRDVTSSTRPVLGLLDKVRARLEGVA